MQFFLGSFKLARKGAKFLRKEGFSARALKKSVHTFREPPAHILNSLPHNNWNRANRIEFNTHRDAKAARDHLKSLGFKARISTRESATVLFFDSPPLSVKNFQTVVAEIRTRFSAAPENPPRARHITNWNEASIFIANSSIAARKIRNYIRSHGHLAIIKNRKTILYFFDIPVSTLLQIAKTPKTPKTPDHSNWINAPFKNSTYKIYTFIDRRTANKARDYLYSLGYKVRIVPHSAPYNSKNYAGTEVEFYNPSANPLPIPDLDQFILSPNLLIDSL